MMRGRLGERVGVGGEKGEMFGGSNERNDL